MSSSSGVHLRKRTFIDTGTVHFLKSAIQSLGLMKGRRRCAGLMCLALLLSFWAKSQTVSTNSAGDYSEAERGADYVVWQKLQQQTNASGRVITTTNSFTELATGMHFQQNGQWVDATANIQLTTNGASALQGQHQVFFAGNINTDGAVEVVTPDGKSLRSHILGLSYFDTATRQSVLIAELKDATGQLVSSNEVDYPDSFTDFRADVRYTYTRAGFEQDIILRQQPPSPSTYGLDPQTTILEVLTEFVNPPAPLQQTNIIKDPSDESVGDPPLVDETLKFGQMTMGQGKAFAIGDDANMVLVGKRWQDLEGRKFLVEEVKYRSIQPKLHVLPAPPTSSTNTVAGSVLHRIQSKRTLPQAHISKPARGPVLMAKAGASKEPGLVLDYIVNVSTRSDFTFQSDTTYYVSGDFHLSGTTTIEGGAVIKYVQHAGTSSGSIYIDGPLNCLTEPYHPAVFTAKDDNSVGDIIGGSLPGNLPVARTDAHYANPALVLSTEYVGGSKIHDLRFAYADTAMVINGWGSLEIDDVQFVHCNTAVQADRAYPALYNILVQDFNVFFQSDFGYADIQNLTAHSGDYIAGPDNNFGVSFQNVLSVDVANIASYYDGETPYSVTDSTANPVFQSGGTAGQHYLNGNTFRHMGTVPVNPDLANRLKKKTTQPPLKLTAPVTSDIILSPVVERDTGALPDIGYHYDVIDYALGGLSVSGSTLTLTNGVVIGTYNGVGMIIGSDASVVSEGSPLKPVVITPLNTVQEQCDASVTFSFTHPGAFSAAGSNLKLRFTDLFFMAGLWSQNTVFVGGYIPASMSMQDCRLSDGAISWDAFESSINDDVVVPSIQLRNTLFERCYIYLGESAAQFGLPDQGFLMTWNNNLFIGCSIQLNHCVSINEPGWIVEDNMFDRSPTSNFGTLPVVNANNVYILGIGLGNSWGGDQFLSDYTYADGPLGHYYQVTSFNGINSAAAVGLWHYTAGANQVEEGNSAHVRIGLHYVALDQYGNPKDTDHDGIPDYQEDRNGNGVKDVGETDWQNADTDYDGVSDGQELLDCTSPLDPNEGNIRPSRLGYWRFNYPNFAGEQGQLPMQNVNVSTVASWNGKAAQIDSANASILSYHDVEPGTFSYNINLRTGTIRFWFQPNWNSGVGPGSEARLIEIGNKNSPSGWWALTVNANGTQINFSSQGNATGSPLLTVPINWRAGDWHQLALTYCPSASGLYVDGQPVTSGGVGAQSFPGPAVRAAGFRIGTDQSGNNQARGQFDELETFNYYLLRADIASDYETALTLPPTGCAPSGLVSWWPGDGSAQDTVGGADGAWANPVYVPGKVGQAFQFDGTSSVEIPDRPSFNPTSAITVEGWVYATSYPNLAYDLISKDGESYDRQFILTLDAAHQFRAHIGVPGLVYFNGGTTVLLNTWYHVAMTYDGSALKLYVNGVLDGSQAVTGDILTTTQPVRIGGGAPAGEWNQLYFPGKVDEASLYNRALGLGEIQAIYQAGSAGKCVEGTTPYILQQPSSQPACVGSPASIKVTAVGIGQLSYQWRKNGTGISGATASAYTINSVVPTDAGAYSVVINNPHGSITTIDAVLSVNPLPTAVVSGDATINRGSSGATITATLTGTPPWNLTWSDGTVETGVTDNPHTFTVDPGWSTKFTLTDLSDAHCTASSDELQGTATIIVTGRSEPSPMRAGIQEISGNLVNFTFGADQTFYVSSPVDLYGTTTFEGGTVIKFSSDLTAKITIHDPTIVCNTGPYSPAIFTADDDDKLGYNGFEEPPYEGPLGYYGQGISLNFTNTSSVTLKNLRFFYLGNGISVDGNNTSCNLYDCQFIECNNAVGQTAPTANVKVFNGLFWGDANVFAMGQTVQAPQVTFQQITADTCEYFVSGSLSGAWQGANSLLVNILNANSIPANLGQTCPVIASGHGVFQSGGDGAHYLLDNTYRGIGTINIDPTLLAEMPNKTTYPPMDFPYEYDITGNITLSPQVPRYAQSSQPDLGYYYDALDYTLSGVFLNIGGQINVLPGTAIGMLRDQPWAFYLGMGTTFNSIGTPTKPNTFAAASLVQEGPFPGSVYGLLVAFSPAYYPHIRANPRNYDFNPHDDQPPVANFRFSNFYLNSGISHHFWGGMATTSFYEFVHEASWTSAMSLTMKDCHVHSGWINLGEPDGSVIPMAPDGPTIPASVTLVNNLFDRVNVNIDPDTGPVYWDGDWNNGLANVTIDLRLVATNNLFHGGWLSMEPVPASGGDWVFENNLFDKVVIQQAQNQPLDFDYNAYWPCVGSTELVTGQTGSFVLTITPDGFTDGGHELMLTAPPPYQSGPLGFYYQSAASPLIDKGHNTADKTGFYHYTTEQAGQVKEALSLMDIGLHYVALDGNSQPLDTDGDGIPDYVEDANGNGRADSGETSWLLQDTVSGTFDTDSPVYDNVDLSGDGLTGAIKRALGIAPLDTSNPLRLIQMDTDDTTGITKFKIPISYNLAASVGRMNLNVGGMDATREQFQAATDGSCLMSWNTTFDLSEPTLVQARFALNDQGSVAVGPVMSYNSANIMRFFQSDGMFSATVANLDAQLPVPNAHYTIRVSDASGNVLDTITGDTSTGMIQEAWDVTESDHISVYTGDTATVAFEVTLLDAPKGAPIASGKKSRRIDRLSTSEWGPNFDVVYYNSDTTSANSAAYASETGPMHVGFQTLVNALLDPTLAALYVPLQHYDSDWNRYVCSDCHNPFPGYLYDEYTKKRTLYPDLKSKKVKSLYVFGHGTGSRIGQWSDVPANMQASEIKNLLGNISSLEGGTGLENPYRFVFLDGCSTASQNDFEQAFGIIPLEPALSGVSLLGPQAYVGWEKVKAIPADGVDVAFAQKAYMETILLFYTEWMNGKTLITCLQAGSDKTRAPCFPFPVPGNEKLNCGGEAYDNMYISHIFVTGHSGLTINGCEPADDNQYAKTTK